MQNEMWTTCTDCFLTEQQAPSLKYESGHEIKSWRPAGGTVTGGEEGEEEAFNST